MKKICFAFLILCVIASSIGCCSLHKRTTILPTGQEKYMQGKIAGKDVCVLSLVKLDF